MRRVGSLRFGTTSWKRTAFPMTNSSATSSSYTTPCKRASSLA